MSRRWQGPFGACSPIPICPHACRRTGGSSPSAPPGNGSADYGRNSFPRSFRARTAGNARPSMCGISGIAHVAGMSPPDERAVLAMRDSLKHRGPDDASHWMAPGVALGSRRLAILDLSSRGRMPMSTPDGRYWTTYNGEVYNFRELRAGLMARGHTFLSNTDTEVILRLFAEQGPVMLDRLNGMFALAIWDAAERSLFLARDRLAVKPLYYAARDGRLFFASEQKALFAAGGPPPVDEAHRDG